MAAFACFQSFIHFLPALGGRLICRDPAVAELVRRIFKKFLELGTTGGNPAVIDFAVC